MLADQVLATFWCLRPLLMTSPPLHAANLCDHTISRCCRKNRHQETGSRTPPLLPWLRHVQAAASWIQSPLRSYPVHQLPASALECNFIRLWACNLFLCLHFHFYFHFWPTGWGVEQLSSKQSLATESRIIASEALCTCQLALMRNR